MSEFVPQILHVEIISAGKRRERSQWGVCRMIDFSTCRSCRWWGTLWRNGSCVLAVFHVRGFCWFLGHCVTSECRVGDLSQHEDGVRISLYDRKEERPVDGEFQRDACLLDLVLRFCSLLGHLKHHLVDRLEIRQRDMLVMDTYTVSI